MNATATGNEEVDEEVIIVEPPNESGSACRDSWSVMESESSDRYTSRDLKLYGAGQKDNCVTPVRQGTTPVNIDEILIKVSTDVHVGDLTYYNGPVAIEQFLKSSTPDSSGSLARPASQFCEDNKKQAEEKHLYHCCTSPYKIAGILILILASSLLTAFLVAGNLFNMEDYDYLPMNASLRMVNRSEWEADLPLKKTPLVTPTKYAMVLHTAGRFCYSFDKCSDVVRLIQSGYLANNSSDVPYNFFIGGDGRIYEGRGWDLTGAFGLHFNNCSIGIGFIGTFSTVLPPRRQMNALQLLLEEGVRLGKLSEDYGLLLHNQVSKMISPGQKLGSELQTWPQWVDCQVNICQC